MRKTTKLSARWKQRVLCLALLMCAGAILAGGTTAYFAAEETARNVISTGYLRMELVETTTGGTPWPADGLKNIYPALTVDKVVTVRNNGGVPIFARITMEKNVTARDGAELPFEHITLDLNEEHWLEQGGYYYYYRILAPGEETEPLFTKVTFGPEMGNEYMYATVQLNVLAQAVQSANNGADPLEALGWSAAGKTVTETVNLPGEDPQ